MFCADFQVIVAHLEAAVERPHADGDADVDGGDGEQTRPPAEKPPAEKPSTSTSKGTPTDTEAKPKPETDPHNGKKPSFEEIFKKTRAAEREHRGEAAKLLDEAKTLLGHRNIKTTEIYANWDRKEELERWG